MSPETWVAMAGVVVPSVATVAVAWINRRRPEPPAEEERPPAKSEV